MYLGLDIGSTKSACVLIDDNKEIKYSAIIPTKSNMRLSGEHAVKKVLEQSQLSVTDVLFSVSTGYGRKIIQFENEHSEMTEIAAIARGAVESVPGSKTVIDIGGQDSKAIIVNNKGQVEKFVMNDMCAAGTGRFIENIARIMEVPIHEMGSLSLKADCREMLTSMCAVFAESEVVSLLSQGIKKENIIAGLHYAIAKRVSNLARSLGVQNIVTFTGGVAKNEGVYQSLQEELGINLTIAPESQLIASYGSALRAKELYQKSR